MTTTEPQREVVQIVEPVYAEGGGGGGGGGGATTLTELTDVTITAPLNREAVLYDTSNAQWKNLPLAKSDVGLSNVDNTSDVNKPVSTAQQTAINGRAPTTHTHTASQVIDFNAAADARVQLVVDGAPSTLDTLDKLAAAVGDDPAFATTVSTALAGRQPVDSDLTAIAALAPVDDTVIQRKGGAWTSRTPTQLKADLSLSRTDVGLSNVDNTSDASKPVSTAQQTALNGKQDLDSDLTAIGALTPTNDDVIQRKGGVWTNRTPAQLKADFGLTKTDVGLGNVDNTSDLGKPVSTAQQAALDTKQATDADLTTIAGLSPSANDTLQYISGAWANRAPAQVRSTLALGNVDNTSDADKPVSTATQAALDGKVSLAVIAAKGDLLVGTADDTIARVAVGSNGQVPIADSSQTAGIRWASPAGAASGTLGGVYPPTKAGYAGWTLDPLLDCSTDWSTNGGVLLLVRAVFPEDSSFTTLDFGLSAAGASPGAYSGVAVYEDGQGVVNRLAQSADLGSVLSGTIGLKSASLGTTINVTAGSALWLGYLSTCSSAPKIAGLPAAIRDFVANMGNRRSVFLTSQSSFPSTIDIAAANINNASYLLAVK